MLTHSKIKQAKPKEKVYKLSNEKGCSGLVNSISDDEGKRSDFLYDAASRLTAIIAPNDDRINVVFDAGGRLLEKNIANGTRTQYSYDAGNKLTQLVNRTGHGIVSQHDYSYDSVGRRTGHIENIGQSTSSYNYNYDNLNRMTQVLRGGVLEEAYTYDQFSNRRTKQSNGQAKHYLLYDKAQQLTSIKSGSDTGTQIASFTYDSKGNLINKTVGADSQTYTYDALERLIKAEGNHIVSENYAYDHKGRRISKKVGGNQSQYLYAGKSIYAEYGSNWNGALAHYTYSGLDQVAIRSTPSAADTRYYHNDGLNSVVAVTNSAGITQASNRFDAWGKVLSGGQTPQFGFTGREPDATGLVHFRARFYDPTQGRFTQRDPAGFSDGINPYIYVGNSPQNFTDPLGLTAQAVTLMQGLMSTYDGSFVTAYVGGAMDDYTEIVEGVYRQFGSPNDVYFEHGDDEGLAQWLQENESNNTRIIAHSWGADMAMGVVADGNNVDILVTVDPVGWFRPDFSDVTANSGTWINYNSSGTGISWSNAVATAGGAYNNAPDGYADYHINVELNHVDICRDNFCSPNQ